MAAEERSVVIIGAGFGGIGMAIGLRRAGIDDVVVLERASGPGGVWLANRYPGASCDVESHLYSFSFATDFDWASANGTREEILAYLEHCIDRFGIRDRLRFDCEVRAAAFDAVEGRWSVTLSSGEVLRARVLVSACGLFNTPVIPQFEGADKFAGPSFHSAKWDPSFTSKGRTIAVIGTGCSAAQFVPEIVDKARRLIVFQRTPAFIGPRAERPFTARRRCLLRAMPFLRKLDRIRIYWRSERNFLQRDAGMQKNRLEAVRRYVASEIEDPDKRAKLMPTTQAGCKRNVRSGSFLKALNRSNVDVVTVPIRRFHADAIETTDGVMHPADVVIYGTGFTASRYLSTFEIAGLGGRTLEKTWRDGAEAYLGITVAGFPNFFMIYGPNTNTPGSIVFMIECQIHYILQAIRTVLNERLRRLEVHPATQAAYNADLQERLRTTSWASGCTSYFMNGARRIVTQFPDASRRYFLLTRRLRKHNFIRER